MPEYTCLLHSEGIQLPVGNTCHTKTIDEAMDCCDKKIKDMIAKSQQIYPNMSITPWTQNSNTIPDAFLEVKPTTCETRVRAYDYNM